LGARRHVLVKASGVVQGIGFRPAVYAVATLHRLSGAVSNGPTGVDVRLQGESADVDEALDEIRTLRLSGLRYDALTVEEAAWDEALTGFSIQPSARHAASGLEVPVDAAVCADCRAEVEGDGDGGRYAAYPLTACTACGPRLTVIEKLPYQREFTTVAPFARCPACARSYEDPADRRFNFETNTCWQCAPWLGVMDRLAGEFTAIGAPGRLEADLLARAPSARLVRCVPGAEAFGAALGRMRDCLASGGIVMIKGPGGYQLVADARDGEAVERLRKLKHRPAKPFAVMMPDLDAVRRHARLSERDARLLASREAPIVILPSAEGSDLAPQVRGARQTLGVFLPYTALHLLLVNTPLVVTSANTADEPIITDDLAACDQYAQSVDLIFLHERRIALAVDDSVLIGGAGGPEIMVRRARGYAPASIAVGGAARAVLAVGADTKAAFAVVREGRLFASPYLGDFGDASTRARFLECLRYYERALGARFDTVVSDLHPGYASTALADRLAAERGVQRISVQHHHAHALSVMAEHRLEEAIAVVCDGTGWGTDGTVWGGEVLRVAATQGSERLCGLAAYPLIGGEAAARRHYPLMAAAEPELDAVFRERTGEPFAASRWGKAALAAEPYASRRALLRTVAERGLAPLRTSSAGRLFDLAAVLLLGLNESAYEADAAMSLEEAAWAALRDSPDALSRLASLGEPAPLADGPIHGPTLLAHAACLADELDDAGAPALGALAFHALLAEAFAARAAAAADAHRLEHVVFSGGCAQNRLFRLLLTRSLQERGIRLLANERFPANDGGICVGQAYAASRGWAIA
jgi:hydrogenase maturation protein HypF